MFLERMAHSYHSMKVIIKRIEELVKNWGSVHLSILLSLQSSFIIYALSDCVIL